MSAAFILVRLDESGKFRLDVWAAKFFDLSPAAGCSANGRAERTTAPVVEGGPCSEAAGSFVAAGMRPSSPATAENVPELSSGCDEIGRIILELHEPRRR